MNYDVVNSDDDFGNYILLNLGVTRFRVFVLEKYGNNVKVGPR